MNNLDVSAFQRNYWNFNFVVPPNTASFTVRGLMLTACV